LIVISAAGAIFWSVQTSVSKRKWYSAKPLLRGSCKSIIWGYANEMQDSVKGWMDLLHCDVVDRVFGYCEAVFSIATAAN